jgi:hypothetical protein
VGILSTVLAAHCQPIAIAAAVAVTAIAAVVLLDGYLYEWGVN